MPKRFVISGGGTGGHIFPAISIAQALLGTHKNFPPVFPNDVHAPEIPGDPGAP